MEIHGHDDKVEDKTEDRGETDVLETGEEELSKQKMRLTIEAKENMS